MHGRKKSGAPRTAEEIDAVNAKAASYTKIMTAVWAKRKAKASDPDAMDLLAKVIRLNPDSYSLWNYRREAVLSLLSQIGDEQPANGAAVAGIYQTELSLAAAAIRRNPKSYATWHHRRWALERGLEAVGGADALDRELELCTQLLELDARNFHCWRHRKWAVRLRGLPVAEDFAFTTGKIAQNFSNYSAFHHRSELLPFVAAERGSQEGRWQLLAEELDMAHQAMYTEPADQSAWWYHQFLIRWAGAGCPVAASPAPAPAAAAAADVPLAATSGPTTAFGAEAKDGNGGSSGDNCGDENSSGGEPEDGAGTVERYEAVLHAEAACMRELVELDDGGKWPTLTLLSLLLLLSKRAQAARSAAAGSDGGGGCGGGGGDISCGAAAGTAGAAGAEAGAEAGVASAADGTVAAAKEAAWATECAELTRRLCEVDPMHTNRSSAYVLPPHRYSATTGGSWPAATQHTARAPCYTVLRAYWKPATYRLLT